LPQVIQQLQILAQIWGAPKVDDDVTFFMNSGVTNSDGSESYMFGNYSERDVDGGFYYVIQMDVMGFLLILLVMITLELVGNVDGTVHMELVHLN